MSHRSNQASCRLTARRRLALGGLIMTGALAAGAFVSTPAFADGGTSVSTFGELQTALSAQAADITLSQPITVPAGDVLTVSASTTIDLHGNALTTNEVVVDQDVALSVDDSTAHQDTGPTAVLTVAAEGGTGTTGVRLAHGSTFHIADITTYANGDGGGAGIGSDDGSGTATFAADGFARVQSYGGATGGAGIGGSLGEKGIHVAVADSAQVSGYGQAGAAGVGGGSGGAGGDVHVAGGELQATQGAVVDPTDFRASSVGAGESSTALDFGGLQIDAGGFLALDSDTPLVLPGSAVVHNAGVIGVNPGHVDVAGTAVRGTGTIDNTGSITAQDAAGVTADPDVLIDPSVKVEGNNYRIAVNANGGAITGAEGTSRHLLSSSLGDLLGSSYSVTAPSDAVSFEGWNTKADGTGTDVADMESGDLSALGGSTDGTPVSATLYAKFVSEDVPAPEPSAPVLGYPSRSKVKIGHPVHLVPTGSTTGSATYRIVSGSLPAGIAIDPSTGVISGSPSASGTFFAEVEVTDGGGTSSTTVQLTVPEVEDLLGTRNHVPAVEVGASTVPITVSGLRRGEHWTVEVDGKVVHRGTMRKAGTLSVSVHLKKARHDVVHTITIAGSRTVTDRATRAATTVTVTSLAAKKRLTVHTVSANGMKLVAVEQLAAGEHVVVKDGSRVIASGSADEYGIFVFPQAKAGKGTSRLTVHGADAQRAGRLTVKNPRH